VIRYRSFRNADPPGIVEVWNEVFTGRSSYTLRGCAPLERFVFAKPYFDPAGFIVAEEDGQILGFGHAGFGATSAESALSRNIGVTCLIGVRPAHRLRGIGSELLRRGEAYLREGGARTLYAGCMRPLSPFYFGLYGGSDQPGLLTSDAGAAPFLERHGYRAWDTCLVFQRRLDQAISVADARFVNLRRRFELRILPRIQLGTWWQECVLGLLEPVEFRLDEKTTGQVAARATVWEMEGFSTRRKQPLVGILNLFVPEELRRQGIGKLFLAQILLYLQEQCFSLAELQTMERNRAALGLYEALGFERVDIGRIYRSEPS
jgi:ribosomal protein S18 acetylase RimI-like enzyme